jgi:hypothetical protein
MGSTSKEVDIVIGQRYIAISGLSSPFPRRPTDNPPVATVHATIEVPGSVPQIEAAWCDPSGWPAWVEGFDRLESADPAWPAPGSALT